MTNRQLAKTVGLLCSFYRAYPGFTRLMLRRCYAEIECRESGWDHYITMKTEVREELSWWREHLKSLNGGAMKQEVQELATSLSVNLYGDASGTGLYLYQDQPRKTLLSQPLRKEDRNKSSTSRELLVFANFYNSEAAKALAGKAVTHYTDNQGTYYIVKGGSCIPEMQDLALETFLACQKKGIVLKVKWKRRSEEEM